MADLATIVKENRRREREAADGKPAGGQPAGGGSSVNLADIVKANRKKKPGPKTPKPGFDPSAHFTPYANTPTRNTDAGFLSDAFGSVGDRWNPWTGVGGALLGGAIDGIAMGAGETARAALRTPGSGRPYKQNLAIEQAKEADRKAKHPVAAGTGNIAGTVAPVLLTMGAGAAPAIGRGAVSAGRGAANLARNTIAKAAGREAPKQLKTSAASIARNSGKGIRTLRGAGVGAGYGAVGGLVNSEDFASGEGPYEGRLGGAALDAAAGGVLGGLVGGAVDGVVAPGAKHVARVFGIGASKPSIQHTQGASASIKDWMLQRPNALKNQPRRGNVEQDKMTVGREDIAAFADQTAKTAQKRLEGLDPSRPYALPGLMSDEFTHALAAASAKQKGADKLSRTPDVGSQLAGMRRHYQNEARFVVPGAKKDKVRVNHLLSRAEDAKSKPFEWMELLDDPKLVKAETDIFRKEMGLVGGPYSSGKKLDDLVEKFSRSGPKGRIELAEKHKILHRVAQPVGDARFTFYADELSTNVREKLMRESGTPEYQKIFSERFAPAELTGTPGVAFSDLDALTNNKFGARVALGNSQSPVARLARGLIRPGGTWKDHLDRVLLDPKTFQNTFGEVARFNREGIPLSGSKNVPLSGVLGGLTGRTGSPDAAFDRDSIFSTGAR